jgi:hypothetical protein
LAISLELQQDSSGLTYWRGGGSLVEVVIVMSREMQGWVAQCKGIWCNIICHRSTHIFYSPPLQAAPVAPHFKPFLAVPPAFSVQLSPLHSASTRSSRRCLTSPVPNFRVAARPHKSFKDREQRHDPPPTSRLLAQFPQILRNCIFFLRGSGTQPATIRGWKGRRTLGG